jgi:hypothetical protein
MGLILGLCVGASAQTAANSAPPACPVELSQLGVSSLHIHVQNTSGKRIVGMVFNLALSDAAEHWKWLHWQFDLSRPIQEFGWNKEVKEGESKKLSWSYDFDREHSSGVALVLTSVLFADGTVWEDGLQSNSCMDVWHHKHKKNGFARQVELPPRD